MYFHPIPTFRFLVCRKLLEAKISAVRKESKIGAFGDTFSANLSRVPDSCFERLTVSDLARLIDAIYDAYSDGNKI